ncbi:beta-N-acetylhexosaminidase [Litoribacillus peritrichatus]|uniref:Beta-hexosaminidase n=1 Tax=Litoribacillus peritrichatus TaxID=718191 RepID=A0ABP7M8Z0_9GAMM
MNRASVILDLRGTEVADDEVALLQHPSTAGVILFSRNYQSKDQLCRLCDQIKTFNSELLITVDHEGGRVQRFREGFTRVPAMGKIGEYYLSHQRHAMRLAELSGFVLAAELRLCGVDLTYAPVLDLNVGMNEVIGDRSFSDRPDIVADLAVCVLNGLEHAGMKGVGKHFPGHGHVSADSHLALPHDSRSFEEIEIKDLFPFRLLIESGLQGVMPAHVIYDQVDADHPAGFSTFWLQEVLRNQLGFEGVVFSDDLSMQGAVDAEPTASGRALAALKAGCNMLLVCNDQAAAQEVLTSLDQHQISPSNLLDQLTPSLSVNEIDASELKQAQDAIRHFTGQ